MTLLRELRSIQSMTTTAHFNQLTVEKQHRTIQERLSDFIKEFTGEPDPQVSTGQ